MNTLNTWIISYNYPSLSYLPQIGKIIGDYVKHFDFYTIPEDEIDNLLEDIKKYQKEYITGKRLKPIEILKTQTHDGMISICTPMETGYGEYVTFLVLNKIQGVIYHF